MKLFSLGFHPFHMVSHSPWPLLTGLSSMSVVISSLLSFSMNNSWLTVSLISLVSCSWVWWRDVIRESSLQGSHSLSVSFGLRFGVILFIVSEVMFFFSLFFGWFFLSLSPHPWAGSVLPPSGILTMDYSSVPLMNTIILLSSGVSITWAHHSIMGMKNWEGFIGLLLSIVLGVMFLSAQAVEYSECTFCISDSFYGSLFFTATGFHGFHVAIGTIFMIVCLFRLSKLHFSQSMHAGFEFSAWYWHFVDVVWLFLFVSVYIWGS